MRAVVALLYLTLHVAQKAVKTPLCRDVGLPCIPEVPLADHCCGVADVRTRRGWVRQSRRTPPPPASDASDRACKCGRNVWQTGLQGGALPQRSGPNGVGQHTQRTYKTHTQIQNTRANAHRMHTHTCTHPTAFSISGTVGVSIGMAAEVPGSRVICCCRPV